MTIQQKLHHAALIANSAFYKQGDDILQEVFAEWIKRMTFDLMEMNNPETFKFIQEYKKGLNK